MARALTASRLRRYVGGLAALSVAQPESVGRPSGHKVTLAVGPGADTPDEIESSRAPATADLLAQVRELTGREDWARAQRFLEEVTRRNPDRELASYLEEVRAVRRTRRRLIRRPRSAALNVELGRLYFSLELGDLAAVEFRRAIDLDPGLAEAHFYLALEHLFRDEEEASRHYLARAAMLRADVPSYETLLDMLWQSAGD